jgi:inward rectifier potassium channel
MIDTNKTIDNTGFSHLSSAEANRFSNKDGSYNVKRIGISFFERFSILHTLLKMERWQFISIILLYYLFVNTLFALIYFWIGVEDLKGAKIGSGWANEFLQAFFFSAQTITTVGYGHIHPTSVPTNIVAALESFTGILTFAVITGLIFARFSKPQAFIKFSENALIAPYKNGKGLMFRLSNYKNNHLTDLTAKVILSMHVDDENGSSTRFFNLPLEIDKLTSLAMNWTVVHDIN